MENIDKELTIPKWVLIVRLKIPQMPQKIQPKMFSQSKKFLIVETKISLSVVLIINSACVKVFSPNFISQ